jgi:hypothetical protein
MPQRGCHVDGLTAALMRLMRPVNVSGGAFHAPYGAPTAGPPPYQPYAVVPDVVYGLGTNETYALRSTRWRF